MSEITKEGKGSKIHAGHRDRMRARFLKYGFSGLEEHEVLELLLYYVVPRRDTNPIAHELIARFGSLAGVLNAPVSELVKQKHVTHSGAVLLKMFARGNEVNSLITRSKPHIGDPKRIATLVKSIITTDNAEEAVVLCLDKQDRIIRHFTIDGTNSEIALGGREFMRKVLASEADSIVIGHNHPGGDPTPSADDVESTRVLAKLLLTLGVRLYDHVIVSEKRSFSFAMNGLIPKQVTEAKK